MTVKEWLYEKGVWLFMTDEGRDFLKGFTAALSFLAALYFFLAPLKGVGRLLLYLAKVSPLGAIMKPGHLAEAVLKAVNSDKAALGNGGTWLVAGDVKVVPENRKQWQVEVKNSSAYPHLARRDRIRIVKAAKQKMKELEKNRSESRKWEMITLARNVGCSPPIPPVLEQRQLPPGWTLTVGVGEGSGEGRKMPGMIADGKIPNA